MSQNNHMSMAELLKIDHMKMCSCAREAAIYFCNDKACKNHTVQPFYCMLCFEESTHLHSSPIPVRISKEIQVL